MHITEIVEKQFESLRETGSLIRICETIAASNSLPEEMSHLLKKQTAVAKTARVAAHSALVDE